MGGGPTGSADQGKELGLRPLGGNETLESRWGGLVVKGTLGHRRDRAGRGQSRRVGQMLSEEGQLGR